MAARRRRVRVERRPGRRDRGGAGCVLCRKRDGWIDRRAGAMPLCWSLDKLGRMTRSVEDAMLVLQAIAGPDAGDPSSVPSRFDFDATATVAGLTIGYIAQWMKEAPATDVDRAALETMK